MPTTTYSTKETAALLRKQLRATWPGVAFSVRMSRGTGHGWLRVTWTDGPTETQVREITRHYQNAQFNGMTDSYDRLDDALVATTPGELPELVAYSCRGINSHRDYSDQLTRATTSILAADNPHIATHLTARDLDTLTYNTLHRTLAAIPVDQPARYHGDYLTGPYLHDLGAVIRAALHRTDATTSSAAR